MNCLDIIRGAITIIFNITRTSSKSVYYNSSNSNMSKFKVISDSRCHTGAIALRGLITFIALASVSAMPFADVSATVNPNNFSITLMSDAWAHKANTTAQEANISKSGANANGNPARSFGVGRNISGGSSSYYFYTLNNTSGNDASEAGYEFKGFRGSLNSAGKLGSDKQWPSSDGDSATPDNTHLTAYTGEVGVSTSYTDPDTKISVNRQYKGRFSFGVCNDEYGDLLIGMISVQNTNNLFSNKIYPIMSDDSQAFIGTTFLRGKKAYQIYGTDTDDYSGRYWPSTATSGTSNYICQIIKCDGDVKASDSKKQGYVWFCPRGATQYVYRLRVGYSESEIGFTGYKSFIRIKTGVTLSNSPYNSAIGYGQSRNRFLLHDFGNHKLYVVKYNYTAGVKKQNATSASDYQITATGHTQLTPPSSNALFAYGTPHAFSLQGHNYLITPYGNTVPSGDSSDAANVANALSSYALYEIIEDGDGNISLINANHGSNNTFHYKPINNYKDDTVLLGTSFSWLRNSDFLGRVWGLAHGNGYYAFNIKANVLNPTACSVERSYLKNGTSAPTRCRVIICNPPSGGYALGYKLYYNTTGTNVVASSTDITKSVTWTSRRKCVDSNATRMAQNGYYFAVATYECDGIARTIDETDSGSSPTISQSANGLAYGNTAGNISNTAFNYYDQNGTARYDYTYSLNATSGSPETANSVESFQVAINNGAASTTTTQSVTGAAGTLTSLSVQPVYQIFGYPSLTGTTNFNRSDDNTSGFATLSESSTFNYYGTSKTVTSSSALSAQSINPIDVDCPKSTPSLSQSLQKSATEVTRMDIPLSWSVPTAATVKGASINSYNVIVKNQNGNIVYSGNTTSNSTTIQDVKVGNEYSATIRVNYNYNGTAGHYSTVETRSITPDYNSPAPYAKMKVYKNVNGKVAIWNNETNRMEDVITPVYRIEVDLGEPATTHEPVSHYIVEVNKGDGRGYVPFNSAEMGLFAAGVKPTYTPDEIASKVTYDGTQHSFYFFWDKYNTAYTGATPVPGNQQNANTRIRDYSVTPTTEPAPELWTMRLTAVYGASNPNVTKTNEATSFESGVTIVDDIRGDNNAVKNVVYYNLQGIRLAGPTSSGTYIKVSLFSDGNVRTEKIIVR